MSSNKKSGATGAEWWRGAVIYQIYPRSFKDSNNDGIGDLKGITEKLDYIASLGVDGVWVSPFFKSPMIDFGYDVEDYRAIDPMFGTMQDFDGMLKGMHQRGLKLIIDLVLNHTSNNHPWFIESRKDNKNSKADWYVWADAKPDGTPPNNWQSVFGGSAWKFDEPRGQYFLCEFFDEQPNLNFHNPAVQEAMLDVVAFWLDKGVDGLRLDVCNHYFKDKQLRDNPPRAAADRIPDRPIKHTYDMQWHKYDKSQPENLAFLEKLRALTDKYKDRMMVAENGDDDNIGRCIEYTAPGRLHTAYSFSLLAKPYGAGIVRKNVENFHTRAKGESWPCWAFSNHDAERVATRWALNDKHSEAQAKMLQALVCSLWGTTFVYQGEELGLSDADVPFEKLQDPFGKFLWPAKGRDGCRTPIPWEKAKPNAGFSAHEPWLPVPQDHQDNAVDVQEKNKNAPLHFFRNFMKWRKQHPSLITGDIRFLNPSEPVLAFARDKIIAVFNMDAKTETYILPEGTQPLDGHGLPYELAKTQLTLPPFGGFFGGAEMSGLIADIGGTNARFAHVDKAGEVLDVETLFCNDYPSLTHAAQAYLLKYQRTADHAVLAVAGPVLGDEIRLTNHPWVMSKKKIQSDMGLKSLRIINDFAAIAHGVPLLSPADHYQIGEGVAQPGAPIGIIGPGTGLGVAAIVFDEDGRTIPITSEGGHVTMCANTQREWAIIAELKREKYSHVSAERLVSGKGIVNIYQAICALDGHAPDKTDPSEITKAGLDKSCTACVETLDLFADFLGTLAGNVALSMGAFGGVYIAGGIVTKLGDWFKTSRFRESFMAKGRYRDYLSRIPTFVITHPYPGFVGLQGLVSEA